MRQENFQVAHLNGYVSWQQPPVVYLGITYLSFTFVNSPLFAKQLGKRRQFFKKRA